LLFGLYRGDALFVSVFFVSFLLLLDTVMVNVVVAVLLDKFTMDTEENESSTQIADATELLPDSRDEGKGRPGATEMFQIGQEPPVLKMPTRQPTIESTIGNDFSLHAKLDQLLQRDEWMMQHMKKLQEQMDAFGQRLPTSRLFM
jgi:hypothetical protein